MKQLLVHIDRLLRGQFTRREDLLAGRIVAPTGKLVTAALVLGAVYGAFMGIYGATRPENASVAQLFATMVKVPLLFLATLLVTFPSLYVFSALANSRLGGVDTLRLLVAAVTVNLALLASFGPITGFFTLSTSSYPFMVVLNVAFFSISGFAGLAFLRRALSHLFEAPPAAPTAPPAVEGEAPPSPLPSPRRVHPQPEPGRQVFGVWIAMFMLVGSQMAWILRPFIGSPGVEFTFFRARQSSFFEGLMHALQALFR